MKVETGHPENLEQAVRPITAADYAAGIEYYLTEARQENVLYPRQEVIFEDIKQFFIAGERRGRVTSPTGTGKTVLIVETAKAVHEVKHSIGREPRILVVEPTKDLVHQTLGRTGEKGFGKFAADLQLTSFFSDSTQEDRELLSEADVTVTTYDSFVTMFRRQEVRTLSDDERVEQLHLKLEDIMQRGGESNANLQGQLQELDGFMRDIGQVATGRRMIDAYDIIILDEAHNALAETIANLIKDEVDKDVTVIGFTATPDANEKKKLEHVLPTLIHDLSFREAIDLGLLAPMATIAIRSGADLKGTDLFDREGDYQEEKLAHLVTTSKRNQTIVQAAKLLVEHDFATVIPSIPGKGSLHARLLADELNRQGVKAEAVYSDIHARVRVELYRAFEAGEIDVLTNTRILGEGWDSNRAKAIIEANPTRSPIRKRQRVGRILRPGDIAVVVDVLDDYDTMNPPMHAADLLDGVDLRTGEIIGTATAEQQMRIHKLLTALGGIATLSETVPADYSRLQQTLHEYQQVVSGKLRTSRQGHYSLSEKISPAYKGLNDEIVNKLWRNSEQEPDIVLGRQNFNIRMLYNANKTMELLRDIPQCQKDRAFVMDGDQWLSAEGFVIGFAKKFPRADAHLMNELLDELSDSLDWRPLKVPLSGSSYGQVSRYEVFKAYRATKETIATLGRQLEDYFAIIDATSVK